MSEPRLRKVGTKKEFENLLDDYHTQGYEVLNEGENSVLLRKKSWGPGGGRALWALLTVWWSLGLGYLSYAVIAHFSAEQVMLKIDERRA